MSEKSKNILLGVLIVGLVAMTVAYAALSTTLSISGTANVAAASWDIHFENWAEAKPATNLAGVTNTASTTTAVTPTNGTLISGLVISLPQPGDTMVYTFDIVNDGSINAKIGTNGFQKEMTAVLAGTSTSAETNDLTYTIECGAQAAKPVSGAQTFTSGAQPVAGDTLTAHYSRACKLTISYNVATNSGTAGDAQTYTGTARTVTLNANWTWVQN